ncbi:MAG: molybdopterin-dependent oxidoreductase [Shinella sp.]|nr:molybdopterin-dependent oxidoreductase [Shinella sp.]
MSHIEATSHKTTCPYCGVGCGVIATRQEDGTLAVKGDPDHPANFGRLCSKGSALAETIGLEGRVLSPEIGGRQAGWDEALDLVAQRFSETIARHGPGSVAFYVSGQMLTEDYYVANKLMKGFIGSANIDTNSRLCMASSVAGHRRAFGSDTVPGTYEDFEEADLIVLAGSNLAWCHPVLFQRIAAARQKRPGLKVVLVDPRRTMTAEIADLHLAIKPDGDVALFNGLLAHLAKSPAIDENYVAAHTEGFAAAFAAASETSFPELIHETGLGASELRQFFALFERTERVVTAYSQGVNQSSIGTDKVNAIVNCHLATGRIGRPGMGPFSLTGQPNAMGGREVGGLANMLAAHMAIENPQHRERVQRFWNSPAIAPKAGLKAVDMFKAVAEGRIKALWIMATNPVVSMPDAGAVEQALEACPFVVVSDVVRTDTTRHADVLLPSLAWAEKNGTVTNSERRISRQRGFLPEPGQARADWWQMAEVGCRMGFSAAFSYTQPAQIFAEHAALSAFENDGTRDFDIGAYAEIGSADFDAMAPFQWPQPKGSPEGETRFFAHGGFFTPTRKACFVPVQSRRQERRSDTYPLALNTGRIRDQWHTMTRTGRSARLSAHMAEPFLELHPSDAAARGIADAALVEAESPHGTVVLRALLTQRVAKGTVFAPMHWNDQFASRARVDTLVPPLTDPHSGQPALKHVAVEVRPHPAVFYVFAVSREKPEVQGASYWATARTEGGWRTEVAFAREPDDWENWCRRTFALAGEADSLSYADRENGARRLAVFDGSQLAAAFFAAREPVGVSRDWVVSLLTVPHDDPRKRFAVIAGRPGADQPDPGPTVCSCFSVGLNQIVTAIREGCGSVEAVGKTLQAGTNCGSCRSEIGRIINGCLAAAAE